MSSNSTRNQKQNQKRNMVALAVLIGILASAFGLFALAADNQAADRLPILVEVQESPTPSGDQVTTTDGQASTGTASNAEDEAEGAAEQPSTTDPQPEPEPTPPGTDPEPPPPGSDPDPSSKTVPTVPPGPSTATEPDPSGDPEPPAGQPTAPREPTTQDPSGQPEAPPARPNAPSDPLVGTMDPGVAGGGGGGLTPPPTGEPGSLVPLGEDVDRPEPGVSPKRVEGGQSLQLPTDPGVVARFDDDELTLTLKYRTKAEVEEDCEEEFGGVLEATPIPGVWVCVDLMGEIIMECHDWPARGLPEFIEDGFPWECAFPMSGVPLPDGPAEVPSVGALSEPQAEQPTTSAGDGPVESILALPATQST